MTVAQVAIVAPFLNAIFYGLYYALLGQVYQKISLSTALLLSALASLSAMGVLVATKLVPLDFSFIHERRILTLTLTALLVGITVTFLMYIAIRYVSASYLALGEIGYPLFVPLFAYLLFGVKELNWQIIAGGILILIGAVIILSGKLKTGG